MQFSLNLCGLYKFEELSLGHFRLGSPAWKPLLGYFSRGVFVWKLRFVWDFSLDHFRLEILLGFFRCATSTWTISLGKL